MKKGRRNHSAAFKAKVALEAAGGSRSMAEMASEFEVHPSQIAKWKKRLLDEVPSLFSDKRKREAAQYEARESSLYEEIGRLKVELDWLKKKSL